MVLTFGLGWDGMIIQLILYWTCRGCCYISAFMSFFGKFVLVFIKDISVGYSVIW